MANTNNVLNVEIRFSMVAVDALVVHTTIDQLNREALRSNIILLFEKLEILSTGRLIEKTTKSDGATGVASWRILDVVDLLQAVWSDECSTRLVSLAGR